MLFEGYELVLQLVSVIMIEIQEGIPAQFMVVDYHLIEEERIDDFDKEMFLALEMVVERSLGKSGSVHNLVHRDLFEALLEEEAERGPEDMFSGI